MNILLISEHWAGEGKIKRGGRRNYTGIHRTDADDMLVYKKSRLAQASADGEAPAFGLMESGDEVKYAYLKDIPDKYGFRITINNFMIAGVLFRSGSDKTGNGDKMNLCEDIVRLLKGGLCNPAPAKVGIMR